MAEQRATVVLHATEELDGETEHVREWAHRSAYDADETGCQLSWDGAVESFFPWSSVLRVDFEPCSCTDCSS